MNAEKIFKSKLEQVVSSESAILRRDTTKRAAAESSVIFAKLASKTSPYQIFFSSLESKGVNLHMRTDVLITTFDPLAVVVAVGACVAFIRNMNERGVGVAVQDVHGRGLIAWPNFDGVLDDLFVRELNKVVGAQA